MTSSTHSLRRTSLNIPRNVPRVNISGKICRMTRPKGYKPKFHYKKYACVECGHQWRKRFDYTPTVYNQIHPCPRCQSRTGFPKEKIIEDYD